jgi:hypothetical protein
MFLGCRSRRGCGGKLATSTHRTIRPDTRLPKKTDFTTTVVADWAGCPLPKTSSMRIALLFPKLTADQQKMLLQQKLKQMENEPPHK